MEVMFTWWRDGGNDIGKDVANILNQEERGKRWKGRSREVPGGKRETLKVEVRCLRRNLRWLDQRVSALVSSHVEVWIDGRHLFNYAIWADEQIRRQRVSLKNLRGY